VGGSGAVSGCVVAGMSMRRELRLERDRRCSG
jgi:hypothetical protein